MTAKSLTRRPEAPPFSPGTRLKYVGTRRLSSTDGVVLLEPGMIVLVDTTWPGRRGTGRKLFDEDGPIVFEDTGEPILDETKDGYSVWINALGQGRIIRREDRSEWEVVK